MVFSLKPHQDTPSPAVGSLEVEVKRNSEQELFVRYVLDGEIAALKIPAPAASGRGDRLWEHMCFELFLRSPAEEGYLEFNFAPSTSWAAYRLRSYRSGMTELDVRPPVVETFISPRQIEVTVRLDVRELASSPAWRLGLSAILEDAAGRKSYWALAHPAGEPDFHHSDCFAAELAAAA